MVVAEASAEVHPGWITTITVGFNERAGARVESFPEALLAVPAAALRAAEAFANAPIGHNGQLSPALERALRDTVVVELLSHHQGWNEAGVHVDPTARRDAGVPHRVERRPRRVAQPHPRRGDHRRDRR